MGLPFNNITNRVSLPFHGPNHGKTSFSGGDVFAWDYFPMTARDVILELLVHSENESRHGRAV